MDGAIQDGLDLELEWKLDESFDSHFAFQTAQVC